MNTNHRIGLASIIGLVHPQPDSSFVLFPKWEALKAVHQFQTLDFNCCFTLQIHTIVGLPSAFNGSGLLVHWQIRDDEDLVAGPITVIEGVAEFEEQLTFTCFVHRARIGRYYSAQDGEEQNFLIYASVDGQVGFDLGKYRIDLDEIFAPMLEERRQWRRSLSYELQGEGFGAVMKVSFGCLVLEDNPFQPPDHFDGDVVEDDSLDQLGVNLNVGMLFGL